MNTRVDDSGVNKDTKKQKKVEHIRGAAGVQARVTWEGRRQLK